MAARISSGVVTEGIGRLIRMGRASRNLSQFDLAKAIGVSLWRISRIETGKSAPRPEEVELIAGVLQFPTISELYKRTQAIGNELASSRQTEA